MAAAMGGAGGGAGFQSNMMGGAVPGTTGPGGAPGSDAQEVGVGGSAGEAKAHEESVDSVYSGDGESGVDGGDGEGDGGGSGSGSGGGGADGGTGASPSPETKQHGAENHQQQQG